MRIVIESPLAGDVQRNYRYLLWCMRAVWLRDGHHAIASHLICPWFMDDSDPKERVSGIGWEWVWDPDNPHWFFEDLGISGGMHSGQKKCRDLDIGYIMLKLRYYHPESWAAFMSGEWPPHTQGMVVVGALRLANLHGFDLADALEVHVKEKNGKGFGE